MAFFVRYVNSSIEVNTTRTYAYYKKPKKPLQLDTLLVIAKMPHPCLKISRNNLHHEARHTEATFLL